MRHLITAASLDREHLETLFRFAEYIRHYERNFRHHCYNKILGTISTNLLPGLVFRSRSPCRNSAEK